MATVLSAPASAWTEKTHDMIAERVIQLFPPEISGPIKNNKAAYLEGLRDEKELFDRVIEESDSATTTLIQQRGMERAFSLLNRLDFFIDKRSDPKTVAYETGRLVRVVSDLFEPLPADGKFKTIELSGYRLFFLNDVEEAIKKFKYVFAGRRIIMTYPGRLAEELEVSHKKGALIYGAYKGGNPYKLIEDDAHVMINRALNFLADAMNTQIINRGTMDGAPFDPALYLQLDRFKHGEESGSGPEVEAPAKPTAPSAPEVKKPEKENDKNKK